MKETVNMISSLHLYQSIRSIRNVFFSAKDLCHYMRATCKYKLSNKSTVYLFVEDTTGSFIPRYCFSCFSSINWKLLIFPRPGNLSRPPRNEGDLHIKKKILSTKIGLSKSCKDNMIIYVFDHNHPLRTQFPSPDLLAPAPLWQARSLLVNLFTGEGNC